MKTKTVFSALLISVFTLSVMAHENNNSKELSADKSKSTVKWKGTKVKGEHYGSIDIKHATVEITEGHIKSANVVIDMTSIINEDLTDAGWNKKLVDHLNSDDFFSVAKYPEAHFVLTKAENLGNNKHKLSGDLTIKGKTNPVEFETELMKHENAYKATGSIVFDRSKYDVRYGSGTFFDDLGDNLIHDNVTLSFDLLLK